MEYHRYLGPLEPASKNDLVITNGAACRTKQAIAITITDSTDTDVDYLTAAEFDTDNMHDHLGANPERITFNTAGRYVVGAAVLFDAATDTSLRHVRIVLNNNTDLALTQLCECSGDNTYLMAATVWDFDEGDYITSRVRQESGGNLNLLLFSPTAATLWAHQVDTKGEKGDTGAAGPAGDNTITVEEEGSPLTTDADTLDFVGAGITASGTGTTKTITVPGPDLQYIQVRDGVGGQSITGTAVTLNLDTTDLESSGDFSLASDAVTINNAGDYRIDVSVTYDDTNTSGGARCAVVLQAQENVGAGFVNIANIGRSITYHRENTENTAHLSFIRTFAATDDVRVQISRQSGSTNIETEPNLGRMIIQKIG